MTNKERLADIEECLENFDHTDINWSDKEIRWLINRVKKLEKAFETLHDHSDPLIDYSNCDACIARKALSEDSE